MRLRTPCTVLVQTKMFSLHCTGSPRVKAPPPLKPHPKNVLSLCTSKEKRTAKSLRYGKTFTRKFPFLVMMMARRRMRVLPVRQTNMDRNVFLTLTWSPQEKAVPLMVGRLHIIRLVWRMRGIRTWSMRQLHIFLFICLLFLSLKKRPLVRRSRTVLIRRHLLVSWHWARFTFVVASIMTIGQWILPAVVLALNMFVFLLILIVPMSRKIRTVLSLTFITVIPGGRRSRFIVPLKFSSISFKPLTHGDIVMRRTSLWLTGKSRRSPPSILAGEMTPLMVLIWMRRRDEQYFARGGNVVNYLLHPRCHTNYRKCPSITYLYYRAGDFSLPLLYHWPVSFWSRHSLYAL